MLSNTVKRITDFLAKCKNDDIEAGIGQIYAALAEKQIPSQPIAGSFGGGGAAGPGGADATVNAFGGGSNGGGVSPTYKPSKDMDVIGLIIPPEAAEALIRQQRPLVELQSQTESKPPETADVSVKAAIEYAMHQARQDALDEAAAIAQSGCLTPPGGGSPTDAEVEMCEEIASAIRIRKLHKPALLTVPRFAIEEAVKYMDRCRNNQSSLIPIGTINLLRAAIERTGIMTEDQDG